MLIRNRQNPVLSPKPNFPWANKKIYNAAIIYENKMYTMIFRAIGNDWISRFGLAYSNDGIKFNLEKQPFFEPTMSWEKAGVEDPRLTKIGNIYYLTYTAYDGDVARLALAFGKNLHKLTRVGPILPNWKYSYWNYHVLGASKVWTKSGIIFPEKIGKYYYMLFGDDKIWLAKSTDLLKWKPSPRPILSARKNTLFFDQGYVEVGPPPIKTAEGWLVFYHGVHRLDDAVGDQRIYKLGALVLDWKNLRKILFRTDTPLLEPEKNYEKLGLIDILPGHYETLKNLSPFKIKTKLAAGLLPLAIFSCGAVKVKKKIKVYYGAADTVVCLAEGTIENILSSNTRLLT